MLVGQPGLETKTRVFAYEIVLAFVVEAEIGHAQTLRSFDQRVAELVQYHLRETVVGIERARLPECHHAATIGGGVDPARALDAESYSIGDGEPDGVERIEIDVMRCSFHSIQRLATSMVSSRP